MEFCGASTNGTARSDLSGFLENMTHYLGLPSDRAQSPLNLAFLAAGKLRQSAAKADGRLNSTPAAPPHSRPRGLTLDRSNHKPNGARLVKRHHIKAAMRACKSVISPMLPDRDEVMSWVRRVQTANCPQLDDQGRRSARFRRTSVNVNFRSVYTAPRGRRCTLFRPASLGHGENAFLSSLFLSLLSGLWWALPVRSDLISQGCADGQRTSGDGSVPSRNGQLPGRPCGRHLALVPVFKMRNRPSWPVRSWGGAERGFGERTEGATAGIAHRATHGRR